MPPLTPFPTLTPVLVLMKPLPQDLGMCSPLCSLTSLHSHVAFK